MVRMDNISAAILTSRIFWEALVVFIEFIQRHLHQLRGVVEWIGFPWRNQSESGGGLHRYTHLMAGYIQHHLKIARIERSTVL